MKFTDAVVRNRRFIGRLALVAALVSGAYGYFAAGEELRGIVRGAVTGLLIAVPIGVFETSWVSGVFGKERKRVSFSVGLIVKTLAWLVLIVFGLTLTTLIFEGFGRVSDLFDEDFRQSILFALILGASYQFIFSVNSLLGPRVLPRFILGRYHHPIQEQRVFMFVDIVGSTGIAEKVGDVMFHEFVNQVFADITDAIAESRGEIYKYLGDGMIVTWPLNLGVREAACISCYFEIIDALAGRADSYRRDYGVVPQVRAGLHSGQVVTGEMGRTKKEIVFLGDTLNTTARLEQACSERNEPVLASGDLIDSLVLPDGIEAVSLGTDKLRGKQRGIELYTLAREPRVPGPIR